MKKIPSFQMLIISLFLSSHAVFASLIDMGKVSPIIEKHIQFLVKTDCLKKHKITFSGIHFNSIILIECLHEIEQEQSFIPLISAWKKLKNIPELDTSIVGQFSIILLLSYHVSLGCYAQPNRLAWLSLISLYAQLNMIPLRKLFDALDECLQQYQAIIEIFPREKEESWDSWMQNYWWVPVTVIVFTLYSFIRWKNSPPVKYFF